MHPVIWGSKKEFKNLIKKKKHYNLVSMLKKHRNQLKELPMTEAGPI